MSFLLCVNNLLPREKSRYKIRKNILYRLFLLYWGKNEDPGYDRGDWIMWIWLDSEINQIGREGGKILKDEEYAGQCRITLERCKIYDAITCGVYGDMVHTAYASSNESELIYEKMKRDLQQFIDSDIESEDERSEFYQTFVNQY